MSTDLNTHTGRAAVATALMALLAMFFLLAGPGNSADAAETGAATTSAKQATKLSKQLRKLNRQVKRLNKQVRRLQKRKGPRGPQGPQGPAGDSPLAEPAAGDLTGTWPNVSIAPFSVDSGKLGDFSVGPTKLNSIKTYVNRTNISAASATNVNITCPAGHVALSGSYEWLNNATPAGTFIPSPDLKVSRFRLETNPLSGEVGNRLLLYGHNETITDRGLEARIHCLSP